jgi:hypothetical protein
MLINQKIKVSSTKTGETRRFINNIFVVSPDKNFGGSNWYRNADPLIKNR